MMLHRHQNGETTKNLTMEMDVTPKVVETVAEPEAPVEDAAPKRPGRPKKN